MIERIKSRRAAMYACGLVVLLAAAFPVSQAIAGGGTQGVAPVEYHNGDCGSTEGKKVIGKTTYKRSGDTLSVTHRVSGADPGKHYYLYLYDGKTCAYIDYMGNFKVDSSGSGSKSSSVNVAGYNQFFTCDYNNDTSLYDCGLIAKVG